MAELDEAKNDALACACAGTALGSKGKWGRGHGPCVSGSWSAECNILLFLLQKKGRVVPGGQSPDGQRRSVPGSPGGSPSGGLSLMPPAAHRARAGQARCEVHLAVPPPLPRPHLSLLPSSGCPAGEPQLPSAASLGLAASPSLGLAASPARHPLAVPTAAAAASRPGSNAGAVGISPELSAGKAGKMLRAARSTMAAQKALRSMQQGMYK
ncbi:unnamed protein product, partial [Prorocentrum cordatum]